MCNIVNVVGAILSDPAMAREVEENQGIMPNGYVHHDGDWEAENKAILESGSGAALWA